MSEPKRPTGTLLASGGIAPGPHRIHPAGVILAAIRVGLTLVVVLFFSFMSSLSAVAQALMSGTNPAMPLFLIIGGFGLIALILVLVGVYAYHSYKRFLWEITETDIHIYSGVFMKSQVHIPFYRVQSIDFNAGIIERIFGIVRLKVETAGGAANKSARIPALKLNEAEALRAEVFTRKRALSQQRQETRQGDGSSVSFSAPRFDPQTGRPLPAVSAAQSAPPAPRFDPQTGRPLPLVAGAAGAPAAAAAGTAGALVQDFAASASSMRGIFAEDYNENAPIEYEYGLSGKELFLASISGDHNLVGVAAFLGILSQIPTFLGFFNADDQVLWTVFRQMVEQSIGAVIFGLVVLFAFLFVVVLVGTLFSYGGFKARRRGGRVEVERGLLQRQYKGVSLSRVQSLQIKQGFIRKLMGYAEVKLLTVDTVDASSAQQNGRSLQDAGLMIHPFVKLDRVPSIVAHMVPDYAQVPVAGQLKRLPKVALRRSLFRNIVWPALPCLAFLVGIVGFFVPLVVAAEYRLLVTVLAFVPVAIIMLWRIFAGIFWYRRAAYGHNQTMLAIRQGFFGQTTTYVPRKKIQWAANHETPLQRWRKLATISATTAAGVGGTRTTLRDVPLADADAFIEWVRPHATPVRQAPPAPMPAQPAPAQPPTRTEVSH